MDQVRKDNQMKAIVYTKYGAPDVLELKEVEKPTPKDDEVLVKVHAVSANAADLHLLRGDPFLFRLMSGLLKPKNTILGADIAGRVEAVGKNVKEFQPGDEVFGDISACGRGGFAEYVCARENALVLKPACLTFEQAAAVPMAAVTALQGLRDKGQIQPGQKVLINGASGGVGTFAVQIAKSFGADVTGVCSPRNLDMVRSIGADHVIDYTKEDFTRDGQHYDLIFDVAWSHPLSDCRRLLNPNGTLVLAGQSSREKPSVLPFLLTPVGSRLLGRKQVTFITKHSNADLLAVNELVDAGKVTPVIDRSFPLREVPEAIRYLGEGHPRAKVVISVA